MNIMERIKITMSENQTKYCEFIMCLIHHGKSNLVCDKSENNEFFYLRDFKNFGFSDLFISYCSQNYLYKMLDEKVQKNTSMVSILPAEEKCEKELLDCANFKFYCDQKGWDIKLRYQFYQTIAEHTNYSIVKLDHTHKPLIEKSPSDRVKQYYELRTQPFSESYGIIEHNELISYLSVSKSSNHEFPLAEINWLYTEPPFRNQDFATKLLQSVCSVLITQGYTVTYHCDSSNIASQKTALKAKLQPEQGEIILQRK